MRNILLVAGAAGLLGLFSACGGEDHPNNIGDGAQTSGGGPRAPTGGKNGASTDGGAAGEGGAGQQDGLAVVVTAPTAASDPNVRNQKYRALSEGCRATRKSSRS